VLALGAWIYVPPRVTGRPAASRWRLAAFGVVGYSFLLRLACLPLLGLSAFVLAGTGTDVPAVSEFARLLPALLESLATTVFVYCLARDLYGKSVGMIAAMLSAVIPLYFMAGLAPDSTALLIACWAGALYFCAQALLFNRRFGWYGGAACVGLGVLLNPATLLLAAALLFYVLVFRDGRHCLRRPDPYLALGILALALVAGVWLATGDPWHALRAAPLKDSYASFFDYFWAFWFFAFAFYLTPVGFVSLSVDASKVLGKKTGAAGGEPNLARNRRFLFTFVFVPVVLSLVPRPVALLPSTLVPVWLAALPLLAKALWDAVALDEQSQGGLVAGVQWLWRPTVVLCLLGFGCLASIGCFAVLVSAE
jgi:4-amino-4-deoxy-L-arabinose transferase-like glycosyltransferase